MGLKEKRVLVTGASRGIGRAIALALASEGASVLVNYRRNREAAEQVVHTITRGGGEAFCVAGDVGLTADCARLIEEATRRWGRLDVLVNNAGVLDPIAPGEVAEAAFTHTLDVILKGTWTLCRLAAPTLRAAGGCIVNISSIAGVVGYPYAAHYALTTSLALEFAPHVRVNAVAPGYTNTGDPAGWSEERAQSLAAAIPLQRFGRPEDVARAVVFLTDAPYVTGVTLVVDGGLTIRLPGFVTAMP